MLAVGTMSVVAPIVATSTAVPVVAGVAVLGNLFPLVTIALAHHLLHERLKFTQAVGVALALGGVLLLVSGA